MLRVIAVLLALCCAAHSEENGPGISEHKTESTLAQKQHIEPSHQITMPANSTTPTIINIYAGKESAGNSQCSKAKDWKEWGAFVWCRSTEWLNAEKTIAIFTVVLAFATFYLWLATRALVKDAKESSQRQLRAYISANPLEIASAEREERFVQITFALNNHGQTPAQELHHIFDFDVFPNPLPDGFDYPDPTTPVHTNNSLFPHSDMKVWFNFNRLVTTDEFSQIEQDRLRLHIWGTTFYRTAFDSQRQRHIKFRASVGGPAFVANLRATRRKAKEKPAFNWTWEQGHGSGN